MIVECSSDQVSGCGFRKMWLLHVPNGVPSAWNVLVVVLHQIELSVVVNAAPVPKQGHFIASNLLTCAADIHIGTQWPCGRGCSPGRPGS